MYAEVVISVRTQRNRIFGGGKYLVDYHVLTATGRPYDMQLVEFVSIPRHVTPHDPNMKLGDYNSVGVVLLSTLSS
jgi:hypothetical protein